MVKMSCPAATAAGGSAHASGTGRIDAIADGSIQRTATSRAGSAATTLAATLIAALTCTSTAVDVPSARWLVAINPLASTTNPDARVSGVHTATTLSCHWGSATHGSVSTNAVVVAATLSTSALFAVSSSTTSPPATMSCVRLH